LSKTCVPRLLYETRLHNAMATPHRGNLLPTLKDRGHAEEGAFRPYTKPGIWLEKSEYWFSVPVTQFPAGRLARAPSCMGEVHGRAPDGFDFGAPTLRGLSLA
jgi:hypothetical protein